MLKFPKGNNGNRGFTLIETMVAVFILTATLSSLLSLTSSSLLAAKYANNEITANYLLQEVVDYVRNDRDSVAFLQSVPPGTGTWQQFRDKYGINFLMCFDSTNGCYIEITEQTPINVIKNCPSQCPLLYYDKNAVNKNFYTTKTNGVLSTFRRTIHMKEIAANEEIDMVVTVEWKNGNTTRSRSLSTSLLKWQAN